MFFMQIFLKVSFCKSSNLSLTDPEPEVVMKIPGPVTNTFTFVPVIAHTYCSS